MCESQVLKMVNYEKIGQNVEESISRHQKIVIQHIQCMLNKGESFRMKGVLILDDFD